ncbi:hypothetical protein AB4Z45_15275 [Paenibacillus sp. MCAF9]|jgi:hypothetical protein
MIKIKVNRSKDQKKLPKLFWEERLPPNLAVDGRTFLQSDGYLQQSSWPRQQLS